MLLLICTKTKTVFILFSRRTYKWIGCSRCHYLNRVAAGWRINAYIKCRLGGQGMATVLGQMTRPSFDLNG